jgi:hypothetical protein
MGIPLDYGVDQNDQLLKVGADHARDIHALCADVATVIFPSAMVPPTESTIAAVSAKLRQIISDIEAAILPGETGQSPLTWATLARSGFLREPDLIDFILARVSEERLEAALGDQNIVLPTTLLDHSNGEIAEAAQTLLAAESLHHHAVGNSHQSMPPELLHKLCWRIAAAHEVVHGERQPGMIAAVREIIAQYSESNRAQAAARKIVHFSSEAERSSMLNPAVAGVHLHVAALASLLELDEDHVVRLIDAGSSAPYAIMLAAAGVAKSEAIEAIYLFRGAALTPREAGIFDVDYSAMEQQEAFTEIAKWASARTSYLAFGQP